MEVILQSIMDLSGNDCSLGLSLIFLLLVSSITITYCTLLAIQYHKDIFVHLTILRLKKRFCSLALFSVFRFHLLSCIIKKSEIIHAIQLNVVKSLSFRILTKKREKVRDYGLEREDSERHLNGYYTLNHYMKPY